MKAFSIRFRGFFALPLAAALLFAAFLSGCDHHKSVNQTPDSSSAGLPALVCSMPRWIAALIWFGSVTRSP